ncbi:Protein of unknown function [Bacillus mobilis]|nr:Protein of unknown function [Bacillus mobilis]
MNIMIVHIAEVMLVTFIKLRVE